MIRRLALAFVFLLVIGGTELPAFAQQLPDPVASVNTGQLNVRSGPGLQYGAVTSLPYGFGVRLVARNAEGNWVLISLTNGVSGWCNVNYLYTQFPVMQLPINETVVTTVTPSGRVTGANTLNVRAQPDENSQLVTTIAFNQEFALLGRNYNSTWAQIRLPNGTTGWVAAQYISGTVPIRSLAPSDGGVYAPPAPNYPFGGTGNSGAPTGGPQVYIVARGDTLYSIARRYGTTVTALAAANGITNSNYIQAGQRLIIP